MDVTFRASGLASGLDTSAIIDKLVELQSRPITMMKARQGAVNTQVSALGDLVSKLSALESAATALRDGGALGLKVTSGNTAFSAAASSGAVAGSYAVKVNELAVAAKARTAAFSATDVVKGGTLQLTVQGKTYPAAPSPGITIPDGASLADVAFAIRSSGAPVSAVVLDDGTNKYLSITSTATGYPGADPAAALSVTHVATGSTGKSLGDPVTGLVAITQPAVNAELEVDGLTFTRTSNVVSDVIPGATLTLKAKGGPVEALGLENDVTGTQANLQKFVDAYNAVLYLAQKQLSPAESTDRAQTLAGDSSVRSLQGALQRVLVTKVSETGTVRSLADLGLKSAKDGSLSIDTKTLTSAIARDAGAVNALFSTATKGIGAVVEKLVDTYADPVDGLLVSRKSNLEGTAKKYDAQMADMQRRVDAYRELLVKQFAAMEDVVSKLKASGNFLSSQLEQSSKK